MEKFHISLIKEVLLPYTLETKYSFEETLNNSFLNYIKGTNKQKLINAIEEFLRMEFDNQYETLQSIPQIAIGFTKLNHDLPRTHNDTDELLNEAYVNNAIIIFVKILEYFDEVDLINDLDLGFLLEQ